MSSVSFSLTSFSRWTTDFSGANFDLLLLSVGSWALCNVTIIAVGNLGPVGTVSVFFVAFAGGGFWSCPLCCIIVLDLWYEVQAVFTSKLI